MNAFDLSSLTAWADPVMLSPWMLAAVLLVLLLALVGLMRRGKTLPHAGADASVGARHRFAARPPIDDEQVALLHYLQKAFPDGAVLFRPRLGHFLSLRAGGDRAEVRQWLSARRVDFLLCAEDGQPLYAFEIDALRSRDDPRVQRHLAEKNHALKSAGIRLIRFKGALATWPPPEVLRERVLASARPAPMASGFGDSGFASSGFSPSGYAASGFQPTGQAVSGFAGSRPVPVSTPSSGIMSLSDLMRLPPANEGDPWADLRKRS